MIDIRGSGGPTAGLSLSEQRFQRPLMLEDDARRDAAPLPVAHALLESRLRGEPQQVRERGVAARGLDDFLSLNFVHAADSKRCVYLKSNASCTAEVNRANNIPRMPERTIDKVLAIAEAREHKDIELAAFFGVDKQHIWNWKSRGLPAARAQAAAAYIGCSIDALLGQTVRELLQQERSGLFQRSRKVPTLVNSDQVLSIPVGRIPVVGTAQLGDGGFWTDLEHPPGAGDGYIDLPSRDPNAYAVRVIGDSMEPGIRSGHFVLCSPNSPYTAGDDVLVKTRDGRSMVKRFLWERDELVMLESVNSEHGRISLRRDQIEAMHLVSGTVSRVHWLPE